MNARTTIPTLLCGALAVHFAAAQQPPPPVRPSFEAGASVAPERPSATAPNVNTAPVIPPTTVVAPAPSAPANISTTAPAPALPARTSAAPGLTTSNGGVYLNFQNASLNDVLTNLSETFGFAIIQEAPVSGTVNIMSRQSLSAEEAIDLLNSVLIEKGYTAIRNGRILKIVNKRDAPRRDIPVGSGSDSDKIPRNDTVVTQILPLRFGEAAKLVENLRPLLQEGVPISANDASNAIIMTDTQTNIHRIAQIIKALDTSVSSISTLTVIGLKFADAKEVATIVTQLFAPAQTPQNQQQGRRGGFGGFGGFPGFGGGAPGAPAPGQPASASEARSAAARVIAVADEQSNSVIISSPEETVATIREMIDQIDTSITAVTDTRVFRLNNADAVELASTISSLYSESGPTGASTGNRRGQNAGGGGLARFFGAQQTNTTAQSGRAQAQAKVVAVGDPRTNTLLVLAAKDSMPGIAEIVGRLDSTSAKKQHVYTYKLQHAQPDTVADVLRGMLGQGNTNPPVNVLTDRISAGANISTDQSSSSSNGRSGTR